MLVNLGFDWFWNNHKIFKKHQKNENPVHMFLFCHVLTRPTDKQGLDIIKQEMLQYGVKTLDLKLWTLMCEERWFGIYNMKFTKNSPKIHFGLTKKDLGLVFHFGV